MKSIEELSKVKFSDLKDKSLYFVEYGYGDELIIGINLYGKIMEISCDEYYEIEDWNEDDLVVDYLREMDGKEWKDLFSIKDVMFIERIDEVIEDMFDEEDIDDWNEE